MFDHFINFLSLFGEIPQADAEMIKTGLIFKTVQEGEVLLKEGDVCREMYFICKGILRIVSQNEKGNIITHFFLKENQFCTILNSFNNNLKANEGIEAACDSELIVFKKNNLSALYGKLPYLKTLIDQITTQTLIEKIKLKNAYMGEDAATRYRNFLMRQPDIALKVSLGDIASYLGITRQSLSRIRKNMR